jgi:hypothetical protein
VVLAREGNDIVNARKIRGSGGGGKPRLSIKAPLLHFCRYRAFASSGFSHFMPGQLKDSYYVKDPPAPARTTTNHDNAFAVRSPSPPTTA